MKNRVFAALLAGFMVAIWPVMASAQTHSDEETRIVEEVFEDITGTELIAILRQQGFAASLGQDSYGDPMIEAQAGGVPFSIVTYGCNHDAEPTCERLQLITSFRLPEGVSEYDIALMNAYNARFLFGRAYIGADGNPTVDYTINLHHGVTEDNLIDNLNIWVHVLDNFIRQGWAATATS